MSSRFPELSLAAAGAARKRVAVLLPYPFAGPFDYAVPDGMAVQPGDMVLVPLNRRAEVGVVWDAGPDDRVPAAKLKPIDTVLDAPPMQPALRRFIDWVAAYTLAPPGEVLAMALRVNALAPPVPQAGWSLADLPPDTRLTAPRQRVAALLADRVPRTGAALTRNAGVSAAVIRGMAAAGQLLPTILPAAPPFTAPDPLHPGPALSPAQAAAAAALRDAVAEAAFSVSVLDGVTGSGKTEVYLEAVAACVAAGRQALVLLPEIALSSQWLERFTARFGTAPAVWHSDLPSRIRRLTWRAVAEGGAPVVVGARSALFLPFPELGLIVVDEEHETAFKQEEGVVYHARDMAVVRARLSAAPAVLVSATPSLETLANVEAGRYRHLTLDARHGGASLPAIATLDLREHQPPRGCFLAEPLVAAVADTIARGEQAMLFLNRRGYAPLTLCRHCGHRMQCPNCTAWLVEHRARKQLACHHCGHTEPIPRICPVCTAEDSLVPIGPGVERITEEAAAMFPDARVLVMASDTMPGPNAAAQAAHRHRGTAGGFDHRHADRRQGLALPAFDAGGRGGRRPRPGRRRPAGGGTYGAVAAPGVRPRRAGGSAGPCAAANLQPGAPGDAGPGGRRPARLHGAGKRRPAARWLAAAWTACRADRVCRRCPIRRRGCARPRPRRPACGRRGGARPGARPLRHLARPPPPPPAVEGPARRGGAAAVACLAGAGAGGAGGSGRCGRGPGVVPVSGDCRDATSSDTPVHEGDHPT